MYFILIMISKTEIKQCWRFQLQNMYERIYALLYCCYYTLYFYLQLYSYTSWIIKNYIHKDWNEKNYEILSLSTG